MALIARAADELGDPRQLSWPERDLAQELIGKPARKEGLEDFLWAIAMLPEFQLIY